ncbi:MAG: zinc ribbon domain-containing protein [Nitrospirae bacterium]|nr:MAG: zinc ribbon domain-containing protein [Nitrospirota bacterium]
MPIYEYRCCECQKRNTFLVLTPSRAPQECRYCRSTNLERIMSRFASPKSEEARMETLADPSRFGDLDENDPKSMARFMKKMGEEMGEDLGDDFDEALEEMEGSEPESADSEVD